MDGNIASLQKSLIYQMSLGSKELYHSNVWAWLIEQNPEFIKAFGFDDSYVSRIKRVGREEGNRDVSIYLDDAGNGPVIVIENKLKSIPGVDQLRKYQTGLGNRFQKGILTGIVSPTIVDETKTAKVDEREWTFLDYESIAKGILNVLDTIADGPVASNRFAIEDYCCNIQIMNQIVAANATKTLEPIQNGDLDNLGLQDLINKVNASQFIRFFEGYLKDKRVDFGPSLDYGLSFHHKKSTIDICFRFGKWKDGSDRGIGIQIEGNQFRRFVVFYGADASDVFEEFVKVDWFGEQKDSEDRRIRWKGEEPLPTALTGQFNKYKAGQGKFFVYQYATITNWSFEAIAAMVVRHLEEAKKHLEMFKWDVP